VVGMQARDSVEITIITTTLVETIITEATAMGVGLKDIRVQEKTEVYTVIIEAIEMVGVMAIEVATEDKPFLV